MRTIDLNADLGEGFGPWRMGDDAAMLDIVTSANIACGGHASDPETMFETLTLAKAKGIIVGAHPSYPDKEGFGRRRLPYSPAEVSRFVAAQTGALLAIAALVDVRVAYVKPHGALANVAAEDRPVADAIADAVRAIDPKLAILAISGTVLEQVAKARGIAVFSEIYADRGYTKDGLLVPRSEPGALIDNADEATARLLSWLETGKMRTADDGSVALEGHSICIHGDSPHAVAMATHLKAALTARGLGIKPFLTLA